MIETVAPLTIFPDMSMHFSQLKQMKTILGSCHEGSTLDKGRVLSLLLHSCDVSHPAKRWGLHHQWTSRCMQEFFKQGDKERELGLEFSPLCDRHNTMVPQSQIGEYLLTLRPMKLSVIITSRFHRLYCDSHSFNLWRDDCHGAGHFCC